MEILRTKNLSCGYHQVPLIGGASLQINSGEVVCLMGRNGCGKSTLLRTITTLIPAIEGSILLNKKDIYSYPVAERSHIMALVSTVKPTLDYMSAYEVVTMGRVPHTNFWGTLSQENRQLVDHSFHVLQISYLKERPFSKLSDGQQQLVMIARALAQNSKLLVLDEPTTFLDIPHKRMVLQALHRMAELHESCVLFSSHDWELVRQLNPTIWLVKGDGSIQVGAATDSQMIVAIKEVLLEGMG